MPKHEFQIIIIKQLLENSTRLTETLFYPEIFHYGDEESNYLNSIKKQAARVIESLQLLELHRRIISALDNVSVVEFKLDAPARSAAWREPISLIFPAARWQQSDNAHIAYIPALGIEIISKKAEDLDKLIQSHIHAELMRRKANTTLSALPWLQRCHRLDTETLDIDVNLRTPKQVAQHNESNRVAKKSVLKEIGIDLTAETLPQAFEIDDVVNQLADCFNGRQPVSALLVGDAGVGKTAAVYELTRRRNELQLGRLPFWETSGSKLVAGMSGYGMWQERCQQLWREAAKQQAVLYFGNLVELMGVGKSIHNNQGIASFFRPYIVRGELIAIAECLPEQIPLIEREDPHLLKAFHQIRMPEPNVEKGRSILLSCAASINANLGSDLDWLETLDRLHRRYATYSCYPGRPIRFLKNLCKDRDSDRPLTTQAVTMAFSRQTGLPMLLLDDNERLDLANIRQWFGERVIGQPAAVDLIVDLIAIVKAGLARPNKPIASLLFIGPTGVGKTEMAKSLAEFLFQDRARILRFDMSEYADTIAVKRLIGGIFGSEGLLTAKVREQPFSVILLDEFEKAHPLFFDLLLQMLGEARLSDAAGRVADFRNSVIIMTSNLGAQSFQRASMGFQGDNLSGATNHFINEVRAFVRPELFNRIDRIVPFAPLNEESIQQISQRELAQLAQRDGVRYRGVTLNLSDDLADHLAKNGFHPRYGARPLKRAIERELLAPLAENLNRYAADLALAVEVKIEDRLAISVKPRVDEQGRQILTNITDAGLFELAGNCATIRRDLQKLEVSPALLDLHNEIHRLERLEKHLTATKWRNPADADQLKRLPKLKQCRQHINKLSAQIANLEDQALLALYGKISADPVRLSDELNLIASQWKDALLSIYALKFKTPDYLTLAIYCEDLTYLFELADAYFVVASNLGAHIEMLRFTARRAGREKESLPENASAAERYDFAQSLQRERIDKPGEYLSMPRAGTIGILLGISAPLANPRYEPERGLHIFTEKDGSYKCLVHTSDARLPDYLSPAGVGRRGAIGNQERRRTYSFDGFVVDDVALKKKFLLNGRNITTVLAMVIEERLMAAAKALIE